jgi:flagellar FliL protein
MSAEDEDGEVETKKKISGKKLILFVVLPVLLLGGAVGAVLGLGLLDPILGGEQTAEEAPADEEQAAESEPLPPGVFLEMEPMTVSLSSGGRNSFLELQIQLELADDAAVSRVEAQRPRIMNEFTVFLRELRPEELNGSEGAYLVREELYRRVAQVVGPSNVRDLLLVKMLVQN